MDGEGEEEFRCTLGSDADGFICSLCGFNDFCERAGVYRASVYVECAILVMYKNERFAGEVRAGRVGFMGFGRCRLMREFEIFEG